MTVSSSDSQASIHDRGVTATVKWVEHGRYDLTCDEHGSLGSFSSQFSAQEGWVRHVKVAHERGTQGGSQ